MSVDGGVLTLCEAELDALELQSSQGGIERVVLLLESETRGLPRLSARPS